MLFNKKLNEINANHKNQWLFENFVTFNQGNHSRTIKRLLKGQFQGQKYTFNYYYYHFHYVNKKTNTKIIDGKLTGNSRINRHNRYGIILPFSSYNDIVIDGLSGWSTAFTISYSSAADRHHSRHQYSSLGSQRYSSLGQRYKTESKSFNKKFKVYAQHIKSATHLLIPEIIEECERLHEHFKHLYYEFNSNGDLCLSFADKDVLALHRKHALNDLDNFIQEIEQNNYLHKLNILLKHVHQLLIYADEYLHCNQASCTSDATPY